MRSRKLSKMQEILCAKVISGSASKRAGKRARAARSMQSLFPDCLDRENRFSCAMQIDKILSRVPFAFVR